MCPGGEGAVLKTVGRKKLAGSNPVHGARLFREPGHFSAHLSNRLEKMECTRFIFKWLGQSYIRRVRMYVFI